MTGAPATPADFSSAFQEPMKLSRAAILSCAFACVAVTSAIARMDFRIVARE